MLRVRTNRKKAIIISVILACLLCVVGVFFAFKKNKADITAMAERSNTSEYLYFNAGASVPLTGTSMERLRFTLTVNQKAFDETNNTITITFADGKKKDSVYVQKGCAFQHVSTGPTSENNFSGIEDLYIFEGYASFPSHELTFDENGSADIMITIVAPATSDVQLYSAVHPLDSNHTSSASASAYSDTRSVEWVQNALRERNPDYSFAAYDEDVNAYLDFMSSGGEAFALHSNQRLSQQNGLSLTVSVPESAGLETETTETTRAERSGRYGSVSIAAQKITNRYLVVTRSTSLTNYNEGILSSGASDEDYWFSVNANRRDPLTAATLIDMSGFRTCTLNIPLPSESDVEYYYYVRIVESVRYYREGGTSDWHYIDWAENKLSITSYKTDYIKKSVKDVANTILENNYDLTDEERAWIQHEAGIAPSTTEIDVILNYKTLSGSRVQSTSTIFRANSVYAQSKNLVLSELYKLKDFYNIATLNVTRSEQYLEYNTLLEEVLVCETSNRIILQAKGFDYEYNAETETGTLTVVYGDFEYKDLALRVGNNDSVNPENSHLTMDCYTTDVIVGETETSIIYNFSTIQEHLSNACGWLFKTKAEDVAVSGATENVDVALKTYTEDGVEYADSLTVTFANGAENDLANLSLSAVAEIVENVDYTYTIEYVGLEQDENGDVYETELTSKEYVLPYADLLLFDNYTNFETVHGDEVKAALLPGLFNGGYYIPNEVHIQWGTDAENPTAVLVVQYEYRAHFKVTDSENERVSFVPLSDISTRYIGTDLYKSAPSGWRVQKMTSTATATGVIEIINAENYSNTTLTVNAATYQNLIIPVHVELTDKWHFVVNYLETYKDTCFAVKKQFTGEIRVADYPDIRSLTVSDIAKILGKSDMEVCNLVVPNADFTVNFDKATSTYSTTLTYGHASLRQTDYNGNVKEVKIHLSSYAEWCEQYGEDWSILFLNTEEKTYFSYSNEIAREDLYGFFSAAVFEEEISDFNYWFKNNTGDGCMTIYKSKEVKGTNMYKWYESFTETLVPGYGYQGMFFCEIFNQENQILYSYFFYLDGGTKQPYLSTGGADDAFDEDSALDNTVQDWTDRYQNAWQDVRDWFAGIGESYSESPWSILFRISGVLILLSAVVGVCYWLLSKMGVIGKKKRRRKKK